MTTAGPVVLVVREYGSSRTLALRVGEPRMEHEPWLDAYGLLALDGAGERLLLTTRRRHAREIYGFGDDLHIANLVDGSVRQLLGSDQDSYVAAAFSRQGDIAVCCLREKADAGSELVVSVLRAAGGQEDVWRVDGGSPGESAVAWAPDGMQLALAWLELIVQDIPEVGELEIDADMVGILDLARKVMTLREPHFLLKPFGPSAWDASGHAAPRGRDRRRPPARSADGHG